MIPKSPLQDSLAQNVAPATAGAPVEVPDVTSDFQSFLEFINEPFAHLGQTPVSLTTLVQIGAILFIVFTVARLARTVLRDRVLARTQLDIGAREGIARIMGYGVTVVGLLIGFQTVGIDLSSLTVLLGALGVGIGFGLQNIVSNFVSGVIILVERPIQLGQRIDVGGTTGRVERIGARSTTLVTNDNIAMVLPNSKFIEEPVINWSLGGDRRVRFRLPVGVSYGCDPHEVEKLLLEVARRDPHVLKEPGPDVIFKGFGDSSLDFELWVWTEAMYDRPNKFKSPLYFAIWDIFKAKGIEIPFPQRDLHVRGEVAIKQG